MLPSLRRHHCWFAAQDLGALAQGLGTPASSRGPATFRKQPRYVSHAQFSTGSVRELPDRIFRRGPSQDTKHAHLPRAASVASPRPPPSDAKKKRLLRNQRVSLHHILKNESQSVEDVLQMVSANDAKVLDERLISALFKSLVRTSSRHQADLKVLHSRPPFLQLIAMAKSRVGSMEGQQLSIVAWGLAMLKYNDGGMWAAIESRGETLIAIGPDVMSIEEMGRLLFGLHQGGRAAVSVFVAAACRLNGGTEVDDCCDGDIANLIHAFGSHMIFLKSKQDVALQQPFVTLCIKLCSALPPRLPRLNLAKEGAPMGADIARTMFGLGKFAAAARPDSIKLLGAGSQLSAGLMTCVNAMCKKVDDRRFCSLLGGLSNLGWQPGPQLSGRLAYRYKRLLAKTWDRESLCMAAVLYASLAVPMPPDMLEATEAAALRLQFDASDSRHTRHVLQAFAIRGFLPSISFQRHLTDSHKRFYNAQLEAHGHILAWQLPVYPDAPPSSNSRSKRHLPAGLKPPPRPTL